ncbi:hypothetical protein K469DRAFT_737188 [Zopfia rhizophila CBS 207.26]|uniref:ABC transporter domain-containing protein n=1 Tax=Zopfia rhizophila CBS 207.26 TaxID=1314779 RepID=A0A6A6EEB6_9PEZI|nr:hypothetical protein K469DRAFT_737188 [Zopfia rhizophila CBS 207.26]
MSSSAAGDGIIRTPPGRETDAPDGHTSESRPYSEPIEPTESSRTSSDDSTGRFAPIKTGTNHGRSDSGDPSASSSDYFEKPAMLRRKSTQATIEDIAAPGDAVVVPQSDEFDLSKFLRMFRHQLEQEGFTTKNVGIVYKNPNVYGSGAALQLQKTVADFLPALLRFGESFSFGKKDCKHILHNFDGVVKSGELLIVLGRPGSGCGTLLKTMCGELHGLGQDENSIIHYNGIPQKQMIKEFKGEAIYNQEMRVGQTLEFAAATRTPSHRIQDMSREEFTKFVAQVVMAVVRLSHTYNTKVGNDFIRGVSGGERKRVSIAEMMLAVSPLAAWDNSTRGLDSGPTNIYFGPADRARSFFERQGCALDHTGDFLTSVTNPHERKLRPDMEEKVPRTPDEFERYWRESPEYKELMKEIEEYEAEFPMDSQGESPTRRISGPSHPSSSASPCRFVKATQATLNIVMALMVGSIFFGTPDAIAGFFAKGSVLFLAILFNALTAISEINSLYAQRPVVEKHASYAFYHPATEATAGIVADIPVKFVQTVVFNIILYFTAGLRREPARFFLYFLITYITTFVMSAVFRTMAALTKTVSQAMALSGVLVLAIVIYTLASWIRWINPVFYALEILVANKSHGREFTCLSIIPAYTPLQGDSWICSIVGAVAGQQTVCGDTFIATNYEYSYSHAWRNFSIPVGFLVFFMILYFVAVELNSWTTSTAEVLVFQRGHVLPHLQKNGRERKSDEESASVIDPNAGTEAVDVRAVEPRKDVFTWRDAVYDIEIKGEPRRLLDHVSGWVKSGMLTALMGVSGAGKTILLDVLAQRTTMGVITGNMFVNGKPLDASFQRKTGYVQQQANEYEDLHLETSTVRESLRFSAMLRQPKSVSKKEKYEYVEEVIKMLNMGDFANAVVGVPGEGLNVEQRKLLTIGVELGAKPKLLLFLSWARCAFLRKLADAGQAVLCTIHQPSAILFQEFDRLLFLAKGGKTVYFGEIGQNSRTLLDYFESHGARKCNDEENPAEYMLEIVNNGRNDQGQSWYTVWKSSDERQSVEREIDRIHQEKQHDIVAGEEEAGALAEFAMPFFAQVWEVTYRVYQQYWRMPSHIFAKFMLGIAAILFIGFTFFDGNTSLAGMQNFLFAVFLLTTIFSAIVQQIQPLFVTQRSLYEVRERLSKTYSWKAFMIANVLVEIPYQIVTSILIWACFYYAVLGVQASERQVLILLFCIQFFIYASAFAQMCIAALPDAQTASGIVTLLTFMSLLFCSVLQTPDALPGFWIFMYRLSPFTYWIGGIVSTGLSGQQVVCTESETSVFNPPPNQTCGEYMAAYLSQATGTLQNPDATEECRYYSVSSSDQFLAGSEIYWSERWRNFGIVWAYIFFNVAVAVFTYWAFRVTKRGGKGKSKRKKGAKAQ